MTQPRAVVSLKTAQGTWRGLRDEVTLLDPRQPLIGASFATFQNGIIDKTGTEIRRLPGSRLSGQPFLGQDYSIVGASGDNPVTVEVPNTGDGPVLAGVQGDTFAPDTGADATETQGYVKDNASGGDGIDDGIYTIRRVGNGSLGGQIEVSVDITGSARTGGSIFIRRGRVVHQLYHVDGRPVIVCQTRVWLSNGTDATDNIACWVGGSELDTTSALQPGIRANNNNDAGFIVYPSTTMENWTGFDLGDTDPSTRLTYPQDKTVNGRIVGDVLNSRLCLAVPGQMLLYEVDLNYAPPKFALRPLNSSSASNTEQPTHRVTKALGIPKGILANNPLDSSASTGSGNRLNTGFYNIRCAYFDNLTGEVGLASEAARVNVQSGTTRSLLRCLYPRMALAEATGLSIVMMLTEAGDPVTTLTFPVFTKTTTVDSYNNWNRVRGKVHDYGPSGVPGAATATSDLEVERQPKRSFPAPPEREPVLEQMAPGATWCRVVRSRLFSGGATPSEVSLTCAYREVTVDGQVTYVIGIVSGIDGRVYKSLLPASYLGYQVTEVLSGTTEGMNSGKLIKKVARTGAFYGTSPPVTSSDACFRTDFQFQAIRDGGALGGGRNSITLNLRLRDDVIAYSEEAFPGVSPAINRIEVDRIKGRKMVGAMRVNDAMLVFSDRHTELYTWTSHPRKANSVVVSHVYGCVSHSSCVEGPFGTAWLSAEGPCLFAGSVRYFGEPVRELFKTLITLSDGTMPFALGAVDLERHLVVWTLLRSVHSDGLFSGSDDNIARSPCDTLLIWNYRLNEFSVAHLDGDNRMAAMNYMPHAVVSNKDPRWRISWVGTPDAQTSSADDLKWFPVYSWDETANDRTDNPTSYTASAARSAADADFQTASVTATDNLAPNDMAYIRSPSGVLRWWGTINALSAANNDITVNSDDGADWQVNDILEGRVIHTQLVTNRIRFSDPSSTGKILGINLRTELTPAQASGSDITQYAWARVRVEETNGTVTSFCNNSWGDKLADGVTRFQNGYVSSQEFKIHIDLIGNGQISLKDVTLEIA